MQGRKDGKKEGMQETLSYMFVKVHEKKLSHIVLQIMKMNLMRTYRTCSGYPLTESQ